MTLPPTEPSKQPNNAQTPSSNTLKFSKKRLALAFVIGGISDAIGAFTTLLPPIGWAVDLATALLLFMVLGRQWLLLPGLALEAIPGLGVLPFWGCWWSERLLSWALLDRVFNGTRTAPIVIRMTARRFSMFAFRTKRTLQDAQLMSAFGGKADILADPQNVCF